MTEVSIISAIWIVIRSAGNNTKADVELPNMTAKHRLFASLNEKLGMYIIMYIPSYILISRIEIGTCAWTEEGE